MEESYVGRGETHRTKYIIFATWPRLSIVSRQTSDSERPKKMYRFGIQVDFGGLKAASVEATVNMIGKG